MTIDLNYHHVRPLINARCPQSNAKTLHITAWSSQFNSQQLVNTVITARRPQLRSQRYCLVSVWW